MFSHVVVDGSNLATEGRSQLSLHQLNEAVTAFIAEHPTAKITVVVDATFGHRIDPAEVPEFDAAVANNELVAPPAGAIGRGDAFVLGIADKVNGSILSNDSYQEFHGQYAWLFDEGRLIGGKPVPHVGWVFVNRLPVRGPLSRKSVSEAKRKGGRTKGPTAPVAGDGSVRVGSAEANKPMPVPKSPPPGAVLTRAAKKAADAAAKAGNAASKRGAKQARPEQAQPARAASVPAERGTPHEPLNDQLAFLAFVADHPVGAPVEAVVDHYSSHGAYVRIGAVRGYVPLRLMGTPAPTSARSAMKIGETVHLVVHQYVAAKRSIDLAVTSAGGTESAAPSSRRTSATSTAGLRKAAAVAPTPRGTKASSTKASTTKAAQSTTGRTTKKAGTAPAPTAGAATKETRSTTAAAVAKPKKAASPATATKAATPAKAASTVKPTKAATPAKAAKASKAATAAGAKPAGAAAGTAARSSAAKPSPAAGKTAVGKRAAGEKAAGKKAVGKKAAGKKAAGKKAAGRTSTTRRAKG